MDDVSVMTVLIFFPLYASSIVPLFLRPSKRRTIPIKTYSCVTIIFCSLGFLLYFLFFRVNEGRTVIRISEILLGKSFFLDNLYSFSGGWTSSHGEKVTQFYLSVQPSSSSKKRDLRLFYEFVKNFNKNRIGCYLIIAQNAWTAIIIKTLWFCSYAGVTDMSGMILNVEKTFVCYLGSYWHKLGY